MMELTDRNWRSRLIYLENEAMDACSNSGREASGLVNLYVAEEHGFTMLI